MEYYQTSIFGSQVKAIKTDTDLTKEELLAQLDTNLRADKRFPNEEINRKKEILSQAIDNQKRQQELNEKVEPLQKQIADLEAQVSRLQNMLNKSLEFIQKKIQNKYLTEDKKTESLTLSFLYYTGSISINLINLFFDFNFLFISFSNIKNCLIVSLSSAFTFKNTL